VVMFTVLVLLSGCVLSGAYYLPAESSMPRNVSLKDVPYFQQSEFHCGPAALAMAISAKGREITPEELARISFTPGRQGTFQNDMISATRRSGKVAYIVDSNLKDLALKTAGGDPVIVLLNLGLEYFPVYHYALVVGYDLDSNKIELQAARESGAKREFMPIRTFLNVWYRAGAWGMVVLAPGQIPPNSNERRYAEAAIGLERAELFAEALLAYEAGQQKWPESLPLLMGLASASYKAGDIDRARQLLRQAASQQANSAEVLNNYAYILAHSGQLEAARNISHRANQIDTGSCGSYCRETLEYIEGMRDE